MVLDKITISAIFLVFMFSIYNYLVFEFTDRILENPKLKRVYRIPVGLLNIILSYMLTTFESSNSMLGYLCILLAFLIEFHIFYKDTGKRIFFVVCAYLLHIMAIRAMCVGVFSLATGLSIYGVVNNSLLLICSMATTLLLANIAIVLVIRLIPVKYIKIINQHVEQLNFVTTWLVVFILYFMVNAQVYSCQETSPTLVLNQIAAPIAVLAGLYTVLFFAIKNGELLGYKEKNKALEIEIHNEQQYRGSIIKDAIASYEFNLTQNLLLNSVGISLQQQEGEPLIYTETLSKMAQELINPEDLDRFFKAADINYMLAQFEKGNRESVVEYRRCDPEEGDIWVRAVTNLMKDDSTGDIKGFAYIKNIDTEKKKQIELRFKAERDSLTSLYNKGTTGKKIDEHLLANPNSKNALLIMDIDNFKNINDHFGHAFGDVVLCELSERLKAIFRNDDVVGRVGGDEFIAFVKNVSDIKLIQKKAEEICKSFESNYKSDDRTNHAVSGSVGIALCPVHGKSYRELYKNADIALYASKTKGKNCYTVYNGEAFVGYEANRTAIDSIGQLPQKSFKGNRIEYVFKILYGATNSISGVNAVLEMISRHFKFSRGYIFFADDTRQTFSNTFEWCAEGIEPQIHNLQNIPKGKVVGAMESFQKNGMYIVESLKNIPQSEREILEPQGIKSMMQFAFFDNDTVAGLIGFDDCTTERVPADAEIDEMSTICNILATFIAKQRATEEAQHTANSMAAVLNNLNSYAYVIERDTYKIIFQNNKAAQSSPDAVVGKPCYEAYRNKHKPCDDCPIKQLGYTIGEQSAGIIYNKKWGLWVDSVASCIKWIDGEEKLLVNCIDITKYRPQQPMPPSEGKQ